MVGSNPDQNLDVTFFSSAADFMSVSLDLRRISIEDDIVCRTLAHSFVHVHHEMQSYLSRALCNIIPNIPNFFTSHHRQVSDRIFRADPHNPTRLSFSSPIWTRPELIFQADYGKQTHIE